METTVFLKDGSAYIAAKIAEAVKDECRTATVSGRYEITARSWDLGCENEKKTENLHSLSFLSFRVGAFLLATVPFGASAAWAVLSFQPFRIVTDTKDVICGYLIKVRKLDQDIGRNIPLPELVIAVYLLRAIQYLSHFLLRQISVFSEILDPFVYHHPLLL